MHFGPHQKQKPYKTSDLNPKKWTTAWQWHHQRSVNHSGILLKTMLKCITCANSGTNAYMYKYRLAASN